MAKTKSTRKGRKSGMRYFIIIGGLLLLVVCGIAGFIGYKWVYAPNLNVENEKTYFYVHTGDNYEVVKRNLYDKGLIKDKASFEWLAEQKKYPGLVKPGRYKLSRAMSNNALINKLRSGMQDPVKVVLFNVRTKYELAGRVAARIESDSASIADALNDENLVSKYGLNTETILTMFIPNTYEFKWNTSPFEFMDRMAKEYKKFWTPSRSKKADEMGFTKTEISVLASIVQSETNMKDDRPIIAGVYINRLNKDIPLQADPTVVWAVGDFNIKRVLKTHLAFQSPYNTYIHTGLPPGPICLPTITTLDDVLNYQRHKYIYFCAKEDFSGYSNFAETKAEHEKNAKKYQRELNKRKIMR